eukprot:5116211-Amphidinium_carterae.1
MRHWLFLDMCPYPEDPYSAQHMMYEQQEMPAEQYMDGVPVSYAQYDDQPQDYIDDQGLLSGAHVNHFTNASRNGHRSTGTVDFSGMATFCDMKAVCWSHVKSTRRVLKCGHVVSRSQDPSQQAMWDSHGQGLQQQTMTGIAFVLCSWLFLVPRGP